MRPISPEGVCGASPLAAPAGLSLRSAPRRAQRAASEERASNERATSAQRARWSLVRPSRLVRWSAGGRSVRPRAAIALRSAGGRSALAPRSLVGRRSVGRAARCPRVAVGRRSVGSGRSALRGPSAAPAGVRPFAVRPLRRGGSVLGAVRPLRRGGGGGGAVP